MKSRGERIEEARTARGLTQRELAERLGYEGEQAHAHVSRWESNKGPSADKLEALIRVLGVNGHWLMTGVGEMDPPEPDPPLDYVKLRVIGRVVGDEIPEETLRQLATSAVADMGEIGAEAVRKARPDPPGGQRPKKQK